MLTLALLLLAGCSQEKNTIVNRTYHNVTARYNGYFNGKMALIEGKAKLEEGLQVDYKELLPIFIYPDESSSKTIYPDMDRVIEKASLVIDRHSMEIKGKEYCKWTDDAWLLMGQAHFYKLDFTQAKQVFDYAKRRYKNQEGSDAAIQAQLWLARLAIEEGEYEKAGDMLRKVENEEVLEESLREETTAVRTDWYVRQKRYEEAIESMEQCLLLTKKRQVKTRRMFILAQLHRLDGNGVESSNLYAEIIKRSPPYEMAFYAKINRALAYDVTAGNTQEIKDLLFKMLEDEKNLEFQDEIYYALADLEFKEGNEGKGIEYLKLSVKSSVRNGNIKGLAFYRLADIYFNKRDYPVAQAYYDSTVSFISQEHPDYQMILGRANSLSQLVRDVEIIEHQDSLQRVAQLSEEEQDELIYTIIDDLKRRAEEEKREKEVQQLRSQQNLALQQSPINRNIRSGGGWYFYNPGAVGMGAAEFKRIWGNRKNEDNWRRSDKTSMAPLFVQTDMENPEDTLDGANDPQNPNYYKKEIPNTPAKLTMSHALIVEAMYDLASVYKNQMLDDDMAIQTMEELLSRYDSTKYHPNMYYQLYLMYADKPDLAKADYYKNLLLKEYPESDYAKVILNPDYAHDAVASNEEVTAMYEKAYAYFNNGYYSAAHDEAVNALELYPENTLRPRFDFLIALCKGYVGGEPAMIAALEQVTRDHPSDEVSKEAGEILQYLKNGRQVKDDAAQEEAKKAEQLAKAKEIYTYDIGATHNFIVIVPDSADINALKNIVSDFNRKFFSTKGLKVSSIPLKDKQAMIVVQKFGTAPNGMDYYIAFTENATDLKRISSKGYPSFAMSFDNYARFFKEQNIEAYDAFFAENYLKSK